MTAEINDIVVQFMKQVIEKTGKYAGRTVADVWIPGVDRQRVSFDQDLMVEYPDGAVGGVRVIPRFLMADFAPALFELYEEDMPISNFEAEENGIPSAFMRRYRMVWKMGVDVPVLTLEGIVSFEQGSGYEEAEKYAVLFYPVPWVQAAVRLIGDADIWRLSDELGFPKGMREAVARWVVRKPEKGIWYFYQEKP